MIDNFAYKMPFMAGYGSRFNGIDDFWVLVYGFAGSEWKDMTEGGPEAKALLDEAMTTFDPAKQQELIWDATRIFVEEAPWIFLWRQVAVYGVNKRLDWQPFGNGPIILWVSGESQGPRLVTP